MLIVRPTIFNRYILALNISRLLQALAECQQLLRIWTWERYMQESDYRHCRLLRANRKRNHSAAEHSNEIAPFQLTELHPQPHQPG